MGMYRTTLFEPRCHKDADDSVFFNGDDNYTVPRTTTNAIA